MQRALLDSVKVYYADGERVREELLQWARQLRVAHPEVLKVGLFGSYATDTYGPFSDADVVLVLSRSDRSFMNRIEKYMPEGLSVDVDIFPYTEGEIAGLQQKKNPWISRVLNEAVWL